MLNFIKLIYVNATFDQVFQYLNQFTTIKSVSNTVVGIPSVHQYRYGSFIIDEDETNRQIRFVEHQYYNSHCVFKHGDSNFITLEVGNMGHLYDIIKDMVDNFGGFIYDGKKAVYKTNNIYSSDIKTLTTTKFLEVY